MADLGAAKTSSRTAIPLSVAVGWALGTLGMSTLFQAVSVLLLRYMTDFLGIAAVTAGLMISVSKLFDGVIDPLIGVASDRTKSRWGRRRPYLAVGGVVCAGSFWLMFSMPDLATVQAREWVMEGILLLFAVGYGLFNIPYLAMPPEMSDSPKARTTLISYRVVATGAGSILAAFVGPKLIFMGGGGIAGHRLMADAIAAIVLVTSLGCFFTTGRARATVMPPRGDHSFKAQIRLAVENRPFIALASGKLLQLIGAGISFAVTPYIFIQILKSTYANMGYYILVQYVAMIASQPFWTWLCRRFGKRNTFLASAPLSILLSLSWLLASPSDPMAFAMIRGALVGFLGGASLLTIQALLPDTIQYDFVRTGLRREGVYSGVYTTIEKVAGALSAGIVGIVIGHFGYISSTGAHVEQPHSAILSIYAVAASPAITMLLGCLAFSQYRLTEQMLEASGAAVAAEAQAAAALG
jgi:GPH family glycoside/pentoside/hexuronide:cation symporter